MIHVFDSSELLPDTWRDGARITRAFNPGLLHDDAGWLLAYRVVTEPSLARRIALCRLDASFHVVPGSQQPLTDGIHFSNTGGYAPQALCWFADPRLYRLAGRVFIYWNSGWHEPQNHQFLQELAPDTLRPIGAPRELTLRGPRQKLEKNWVLFEAGGVFAVYSVNPHRVLRVSLEGDGPIECVDEGPAIPNPGGYAQVHGGLRGGTPPVRHAGHFYSFCHSIENASNGYQYVMAPYRFADQSPFKPTDMPRRPLALGIPNAARRSLPKLNSAIADVVYPAGLAWADGKWVVSFGIDDERCAVACIDHRTVLDTLEPVA